MSDILCVTNRRLCHGDFLAHMEKIAAARPAAIILREKDLKKDEYRELAAEMMKICRQYDTLCILHSFWDVSARLGCRAIHLPMPVLRSLSEKEKAQFDIIGASCHCAEEAMEAEKLGCTYITAGHIFDTQSKEGTPGRGTEFLRKICERASIPVYAIGGISPGGMKSIREAGAKGACIMSGMMTCRDPGEYLAAFKEG